MPTYKDYTSSHRSHRAAFRHDAAATIQAVVRRRKAKASYRNLKLSKPVSALVDRKLDREQESHQQGYWERRYQFTNQISDDVPNRIQQVIPDITVASSRADREGATIKLTRLNIKGKIDVPADDNPLIGNDDRAQIYVRMFVLSSKRFVSIEDVRNNWTAGANLNSVFFKQAQAGQAPTGRYIDMLRPVNHSAFTTHYDKVFKLDRNYGYFPDPTSTSGAAPQRPTSREFSINLKVKNKHLKYNVSSSLQPNNWQPFVCCMFAYGNGAVPSLSAVPYIEYLSLMTFKPN